MVVPKSLDAEKVQRLYQLYDENDANGGKKYSIKAICEMMNISKSTLLYLLEPEGEVVEDIRVDLLIMRHLLTVFDSDFRFNRFYTFF